MASNRPPQNSPFVVSVSGHRNLHPAGLAHLREAVTAFMRQLKQHLPDTELRIMVGMADGADLLVAQSALDLGLHVDAVLPMPLAEYAEDFDAAALVRLRSLLRHSNVRSVELSLSPRARGTAVPPGAAARDALYANLTAHLVRCSSLLLALWDGRMSSRPGGTADTVLRYLGMRTAAQVADGEITFVDATGDPEPASQLAYWIPAARNDDDEALTLARPCFLSAAGDDVLQRHYDMPSQLQHELAALNHYNQEYQQLAADGNLDLGESLLATLPQHGPLADRVMLEQIDAQYGKADALAVYYQKRSDRLFLSFSLMAFAMGLAYLIYEKFTETRLLLFFYAIILLSGLGLYHLLRDKRWFAKHLIYRVLAETIRVKFYLRIAEADRLVDAAEVISLSGVDQFHGFSWIRHALKSAELVERRPDPAGTSTTPQEVDRVWIENQGNYFASKVVRLERSHRHGTRLRTTLLVVIALVILALFFLHEHLSGRVLGIGIPLRNMLTFLMGFAAVLLGVWELHQNKMATRELLWQYRNQLNHFSRARTQLSRISARDRRIEVLAELGKDSLMESYLWTIHRYHREHTPPTS